ncbi:MAG TPA: hypothetical protein VNZ64_16625 [Candidatus Acidoferrum sp.]|jgi:hypothetical protein|nr:hypothetical protein [Candidatus Acidoferrum sp.]
MRRNGPLDYWVTGLMGKPGNTTLRSGALDPLPCGAIRSFFHYANTPLLQYSTTAFLHQSTRG